MAKLDEYYQNSGASDAHLIAMGKTSFTASSILTNTVVVLNPTVKMNHFKKQWSQELVLEVEDAVCACICIPFFFSDFWTTDIMPSLCNSILTSTGIQHHLSLTHTKAFQTTR